MKTPTRTSILAAIGLAGSLAWPAFAQQSAIAITGLTFVDHLEAGMIEQDVFVEKAPGSGQVFRVTKKEMAAYLDRPVHASARVVHHAPFNPKRNGPHPKGRSLGMTLKQWLSATGSAEYSCRDGKATLQASFTGLVPKGVYTMWHAMAAKPHMGCANCAFATLDLPIGAADGSQSPFVARDDGTARFSAGFEPCLQLGRGQVMSMLAIAYHSDGKTYGEQPGGMGKVAHVQLFVPLPDEGAWRTR